MDEIPILVSVADGADEEVKGWWRSDGVVELRKIPVEKLRQNLTAVCGSLMQVLQDIKAVGNFKLREVTVQVEVTADAGVNFVGTAKIAGKGAITLKFGGD